VVHGKTEEKGAFVLEIIIIAAAVLAVAILIVLILASTKPDTFRVQRSVTVGAPAEKIFPLISDFHQWANWSPWENRDPAMKRTYSGTESGKGAVYAWDGNRNVGSGRMEILDVTSPLKIVIKLDFIKPFEGHNTAEFSIQPESGVAGTITNISWVMHGPAPFMHRVMQVFMNFDKMIGKDFEAGLAKLKILAEK
jgi:uncharacterized protein YndB with AHSA1/START domain